MLRRSRTLLIMLMCFFILLLNRSLSSATNDSNRRLRATHPDGVWMARIFYLIPYVILGFIIGTCLFCGCFLTCRDLLSLFDPMSSTDTTGTTAVSSSETTPLMQGGKRKPPKGASTTPMKEQVEPLFDPYSDLYRTFYVDPTVTTRIRY